MPKINQDAVEVLVISGSLAANASTSGSAISWGYQRLVGFINPDVDTEIGSGLHIRQSVDYGSNWDLTSASDLVEASGAIAACNTTILGNAIEVRIRNGGAAASALRCAFYLVPI